MSFDEQPDGDPNGECAAEIHRLKVENTALSLALETENAAATRYAQQVAHWIEKHDAIQQGNAALKVHHDAQKAYLADVTASRDSWLAAAKEWSKKLLAAQHRIKVLRGALESCGEEGPRNTRLHSQYFDSDLIDKALALPDSTAELDAVMKDAERLDWLEQHSDGYYNLDRITSIVATGFKAAGVNKFVPSIREAIDAAMKEQ